MKFRVGVLFFSLASLFVFSVGNLACAAPLSSEQVNRLIQRSPTTAQYPGSEGVVWKRALSYSQNVDGSVTKKTELVVLASDAMDKSWLDSLLYVSAGGSMYVEQADIFDVATGEKLESISMVDEVAKNGRYVMSYSKRDGFYVIVLSFSQRYFSSFTFEDTVWFGTELPVWEGTVTVTADDSDKLFYYCNKLGTNPVINKSQGKRVYEWTYFNAPALDPGFKLIDDADYFVAFSLKQDNSSLMLYMKTLDARTWKAPPMDLAPKAGMTKEDVVSYIGKFWRGHQRLEDNHELRPSHLIPDDGPWTTREAAYVLRYWLGNVGWDVDVWWNSALPLTDGYPLNSGLLTSPVFHIKAKGESKGWFYVPGEPFAWDDSGNSPSLLGGTIYSFDERKQSVARRNVSAGKASDNRLTLQWNVKTHDDGLVEGKLDIRARGGWSVVLAPLSGADRKRKLVGFFSGLERWIDSEKEIEVKNTESGLNIQVPIYSKAGITSGRGVMVYVPSIIPTDFLRLVSSPMEELTFRFPFLIDQNYDIFLPAKHKPLSPLPKVEQGADKASYKSTYRYNNVNNSVITSERLLVPAVKFDKGATSAFYRLLRYWGQWNSSAMPVVTK